MSLMEVEPVRTGGLPGKEKMSLLKKYLVVAAFFEFIPLARILLGHPISEIEFFFSDAIHEPKVPHFPTNYLTTFFLGVLVASRLTLARDMRNRSVFALTFLIHAIEAVSLLSITFSAKNFSWQNLPVDGYALIPLIFLQPFFIGYGLLTLDDSKKKDK